MKLKMPISQQPMRGKQGTATHTQTPQPLQAAEEVLLRQCQPGLRLCKQLPGGEALAQPARGRCSNTAMRGDTACPLFASQQSKPSLLALFSPHLLRNLSHIKDSKESPGITGMNFNIQTCQTKHGSKHRQQYFCKTN